MAVIDEIVKVVVEYAHPGGSEILNVFHFQVTAPTSDEQVLLDFSAWVQNEWGAAWKSFAEEDIDIIGVSCDIVSPLGQVQRNLGTEVLAIPGLVTSSPAQSQTACSIFADTSLPKSRGRKFIPGLATAHILNGRLPPVAMTNLAALLVVYLASYIADGEYRPGVLGSTLSAFLPFVGAGGFDDIIDNQSRRRPDRGS